jgi:hypothetical protein
MQYVSATATFIHHSSNSYIIAPPNISRNESSSEYRISSFYRPLRSKVQGPRSKVRGPRSEVRGPRSEVRGPRSEVRGPRSEVRGPRSEVRGPRSEVQGPRSEVQGPRSTVRGPGPSPKSKVRGPRSEVRGPRSKVSGNRIKKKRCSTSALRPHSYIIHQIHTSSRPQTFQGMNHHPNIEYPVFTDP